MTKTVIAGLLLCLVTTQTAFAQTSAIRTSRRPIPDQYIVVLANDDDPDAVAAQTASIFRGTINHVYRSAVRGFAVRLNRNAAIAVANDPRVLYVEEDGTAQLAETQLAPPWGLDRIDARTLPLDGTYRYTIGTTPVYAHILDTGIRSTHVEFGGRAFVAGDYIDDDRDGDPSDIGNDDANTIEPDGADCHGHGTHVAGTIGGSTFGIAKNVLLYSHRVLNCMGSGPISGIIAAIDDVVADGRRPAIVNLSLGSGPSSALDDAVRRGINAGITFVVAAGNDGIEASLVSPARVAEAITVGATDSRDVRASWSNFGTLLDLFAPGVGIDSAGLGSNTATARMSGTSMATPHVTGVAALFLEQGDAPPAAVRDSLVAAATADVIGNPGTSSPNRLLYSGFLIFDVGLRVNVASAANGGVALGSSTANAGYAAAGAINGDHRGVNWGAGGGWKDATAYAHPDWLEVAFSGPKTIDEVAVFSLQDAYKTPSEPTSTMTFSLYGLVDFTVQYWTGTAWQAVPGGVVRGNMLVWRSVTFAPLTTSRIRVLVERARDGSSRIVEVEAYGDDAVPNTPPVAALTAPLEGDEFVAPAGITVSANASDGDGIRDVTFLANGAQIGTDSVAPFSISWNNVAAGNYTLTAVASDMLGGTTTSSAVHITVTAAGSGRVNTALAANGSVASASSTANAGYAAAGTINGDRRGINWSAGGGWKDATAGTFPDWLEVAFSGPKTIDEIAVFSLQDAYKTPSEPTSTMTLSSYGLVDFTVQYWTGATWQAVPGGVVRGNTLVWKPVVFAPLTTSRIRVLVERARDASSRIVEVEAYTATDQGTATEWFVAPGGTGSGTSGAPFGRIQDGLNAARPGDIVTVRAGTYAERLTTMRSGSASQPIRLRADGNRGSVTVTAAGGVLNVNHAYITVEGLVLDGQYAAADAVNVSSASDYFTLRNSEVRRSTRDLIDMGSPDNVLIENSLIHHALNAANGRTDAHGIVAGAARNLTVRNTEIHTFSGDGFQIDPGRAAPGWTGVLIEGSRIWLQPLPAPENGFAAGVVPGENAIDTKADPALPRASITIRDVTAHGFRNGLIGNMAAFNLKENIQATVDRVTVSDSEIAFRLRGPTATTPAGARVTLTNAVIHNVATAFRYENDIEVLRIWNTTLGLGITRTFEAASSNSLGLDVRNLLSIPPLSAEAPHASNRQVTNAAFVNAAGHNYALAAGSPAIDAGVAITGVTTDRVGVGRPQAAAYDIGAYERPAP